MERVRYEPENNDISDFVNWVDNNLAVLIKKKHSNSQVKISWRREMEKFQLFTDWRSLSVKGRRDAVWRMGRKPGEWNRNPQFRGQNSGVRCVSEFTNVCYVKVIQSMCHIMNYPCSSTQKVQVHLSQPLCHTWLIVFKTNVHPHFTSKLWLKCPLLEQGWKYNHSVGLLSLSCCWPHTDHWYPVKTLSIMPSW